MINQKCAKCGHKFTYKEKFDSCIPIYSTLKCKVCGAEYIVLFSSRLTFGILVSAPIFISTFLQLILDNFISIIYFALSIIYIVILLFLYPAFIRFKLSPKNKQIENIENKEP